MIAAILRAQWLSMRFGRGSILSIIAGIVWYGLWTTLACGAGFFAAKADPRYLQAILPLGFLGVCLYWQMMPLLSASMGASLDMRKLLVYPAPHSRLFVVEVLLRFTTAIEMLLVITATVIGLAFNPETGAGAFGRSLAAASVFIIFNLLLASGTRSILERLLARRRIREVLALALGMLWVMPRVFLSMGYKPQGLLRAGRAVQLVGLPWTAVAHIALPYGMPRNLLLAWASLLGWTLLAWWFGPHPVRARPPLRRRRRPGHRHFRRAPTLPRVMEAFYRLPSLFWRDPLAGIVEKELRSLVRTPRFRMVFIMGFTFGLALWFPIVATRSGTHRAASPYFLVIVSLYALTLLGQVSFWNSFGFDRSAAGFYFAAPQPISKVLLGKNIAALFFVYSEVLIVAAVTTGLGLTTGWADTARAFIATGVCALYLLAVGNISSVRFPRSMSAERVSQGGNSRGVTGLLFLLYPLALLPVGLAYAAAYAFDSQIAFSIVLAFAAAIGGTIYWLALGSAIHTATTRRESILQELSRGEGPVVAD